MARGGHGPTASCTPESATSVCPVLIMTSLDPTPRLDVCPLQATSSAGMAKPGCGSARGLHSSESLCSRRSPPLEGHRPRSGPSSGPPTHSTSCCCAARLAALKRCGGRVRCRGGRLHYIVRQAGLQCIAPSATSNRISCVLAGCAPRRGSMVHRLTGRNGRSLRTLAPAMSAAEKHGQL